MFILLYFIAIIEMFVLKTLECLVCITPQELGIEYVTSFKQKLNLMLGNKIVPQMGLGIALFDVLNIGESKVMSSNGNHYTNLKFRFIFFSPFVNEIIVGTVRNCTKDGVYVSLNFFTDIVIPESNLQNPSSYNESEGSWVWIYYRNRRKHELWIEVGDDIKFRVTRVKYLELSEPDESNKPYYVIEGTIDEPGLGVLKWWDGV